MDNNKSFVKFEKVDKSYDGETLVVKNLNLDIANGEFLTMLGPSGSGKTTCLMMLAGFETPTNGEIYLEGQPISNIPPNKRGIGMVFQNYALFPHMTVKENLMFPLEVRKVKTNEIEKKVKKTLDMVELGEFGNRMPLQLSGGQQQRVALARALAPEPKVLLLDEPLSALDLKLRQAMRIELKTLQRETGITFVFVTHDQEEALTMSDRIAVVNEGKIQQIGKPEEIYERPKNKFVADFIGEANLLKGTCLTEGEKGICKLDMGQEISLPLSPKINAGDRVTIFIRPERIKISKSTSENSKAIIKEFTYLGNSASILINANEQIINANIPVEDVKTFKAGDYIKIELPKENLQVIDA